MRNLILVCSRHHTLIHTDGIQLTLHPDRTLHVHTSDGTHIPHHPTLHTAPAAELPAGQFTASGGDRLDLDHAVWVLRQQAA